MGNFIPKEAKKFMFYAIILVILEAIGVGYIGYWKEFFWQAVQNRNIHQFFILLLKFTIVALALCYNSGKMGYYISYTALLIRTELTNTALNTSYNQIEGGEQRVQEDPLSYPLKGLNLLFGGIRTIINISIFSTIIIYRVGFSYLILPILYSTIATFISYYIAKPLINLNYLNQKTEAKLRHTVSKIDTNQLDISNSYNDAYKNNLYIFLATKKLAYFQSFYNQITAIIPYVLTCFLYFGGSISFGVFMQLSSSIGKVIDSMAYLINSFNDINSWLSCRKRLKELGIFDKNKT